MYSGPPGLKGTFSSFESGSRNGPRGIKLKPFDNQSAVWGQKADFEVPRLNYRGYHGFSSSSHSSSPFQLPLKLQLSLQLPLQLPLELPLELPFELELQPLALTSASTVTLA